LDQSFQTLSKKDCTIIIPTDHDAVQSLYETKVRGDQNTSTSLHYKVSRHLSADPRHAMIVREARVFGAKIADLPSKLRKMFMDSAQFATQNHSEQSSAHLHFIR